MRLSKMIGSRGLHLSAVVLLLPLVAFHRIPDPVSARDLIPDGMHRIKFIVSIDAKAFPGSLCRAYQIAPGDTIAEIARKECADGSGAEEIRLLNPEVKDQKLRPGDYLRIPPRRTTADSRAESRVAESWVLFAVRWERSGRAIAAVVVDGEPVNAETRSGLRIVAVPRDRLLWFLKLDLAKTSLEHPIDAVVSSDAILPVWVLQETDPVITIEKHVTLKHGKSRSLEFQIEERRFDKTGTLLSQDPEPRKSEVPAGPLALIGIGALIATALLARRRRTQPIEEPAS